MSNEIDVVCPKCNQVRKMKRTSFKGVSKGPPFLKCCMHCGMKRTISEEQKAAISQALTGRTLSDETKQKISDNQNEISLKNLIPGIGGGHNKGKKTGPRSEEIRRKISETMKRKSGGADV